MTESLSDPVPPLILIVDDYEDAREMYAEYFRMLGYRVAVAADGLGAVLEAATLLPALVVMDLSLPGLDGWEATRQIKADPRTSHIPILAITGHALSSAADRATAAGCDAFVLKPCALDHVMAEVQRLLARPVV